MPFALAKNSIGISWGADGRCYGVLIRRNGNRYTILKKWKGRAGISMDFIAPSGQTSEDSIAACISSGSKKLDVEDAGVIIIGESGNPCGFTDVEFPQLSPLELKNALSFELSKHSPLPIDKLSWGYRIIEKTGPNRQRVRLAFYRSDRWNRTIDELSMTGLGVDVVIPPIVAADPVLSDTKIFIRGAYQNFLLTKDKEGARKLTSPDDLSPSDLEEIWGVCPNPLCMENLDQEAVEALEEEEKLKYADAVLLALYGLSGLIPKDKKSWMNLPMPLRPQRYRFSKALVAALSIYIICICCVWAARSYMTARSHYQQIKAGSESLNDKIDTLLSGENPKEQLELLRAELEGRFPDRPVMGECLSELSELVDDTAWARRFRWDGDDGKISLELTTEDENLDHTITEKLERSPLLADVKPPSSNVRIYHGVRQTIMNIDMWAGYDRKESQFAPPSETDIVRESAVEDEEPVVENEPEKPSVEEKEPFPNRISPPPAPPTPFMEEEE